MTFEFLLALLDFSHVLIGSFRFSLALIGRRVDFGFGFANFIIYSASTYRDVTSVNVVRCWITFDFFQNNTRMIIC